MDAGEVWDTLTRRLGSTTASAPVAALRLSQEPKLRHLPLVPRTPGMIAPSLRRTIRGLVVGELPWPLFLHGPPGTGKTCAALCLLDHAGGEYVTLPGFCEHLIAAQHGRVVSYVGVCDARTEWPEKIWEMVSKITCLVVDEIGVPEPSPFKFETLKKALDLRYGRPAIFISNVGLKELERLYDDRVTSRLAQGTVVLLDGPDRRLHK
jgi:hypothetical protein